MPTFATTVELRSLVGADDTGEDVELIAALEAAEQAVREWCGTDFAADTSATTRRFTTCDLYRVELGQSVIGDVTGLVVATDDNDDGTAETTWSAADYRLEPLDGVGPDGKTGWPYRRLVVRGTGKTFPQTTFHPAVHVTARWGWAATPSPVKWATLLLAHDLWKARAAPFGVAGFGDYGVLRIRQNEKVGELLAAYRSGQAIAGMA